MSHKRKAPFNRNVLQRWVTEHSNAEGIPVARLQRWISFMVLIAALDQIRNEADEPLFLIKGGVALELRFGLRARATKDLDAVFRDEDGMLDQLDEALREPYDDFTFTRTAPETVRETGAVRLDVRLAYKGRPWSTVQFEIAPAEASEVLEVESVNGIAIDQFGLKGPERVPCAGIRYQIAQKLHACTEEFAEGENTRFRDLIDLILLRELVKDGQILAVREACAKIFEVRAKHSWPPAVAIADSWPEQYAALAAELEFTITDVQEAAARVQEMIDEIDAAT